jgi:hypothetical protein
MYTPNTPFKSTSKIEADAEYPLGALIASNGELPDHDRFVAPVGEM